MMIVFNQLNKNLELNGERMTLNEAIGLVERYKHKLIADCYPVE